MANMRKVISICDYSFIATNGKKTTETYRLNRASLIGSTPEEIKADSTWRNYALMKAHYLRMNKTISNNNEFKFKMTSVKVHDLAPNGEPLKKNFTNW